MNDIITYITITIYYHHHSAYNSYSLNHLKKLGRLN